MQGPSVDRLASLPDATLRNIFATLSEHSLRDLCNVSRLNKHYHRLADGILYKKVQFLTPELHLLFSRSLRRNPRRGSIIHEVALAYPASSIPDCPPPDSSNESRNAQHWDLPIDTLSKTVSRMSNLEILDIAVPDRLLHGIGHLFNGPFDLACLQTCTLYYQCDDDAYWDLQENIHIFAQPTVRNLTIKRAKLDFKGFDFLEKPEKTALTKLHLIDCDFNDDALSDLMVFPEALKEFVMTNPAEPKPELEESSTSIKDYMDALRPACETIESITIDSPSLESTRPLALREYTALKTLRLNWDHQLFGKSSNKPRKHSVGLPPELETLEFLNELGTDDVVTDLFVVMLQTVEFTMRKLSHIIVIEEENGRRIPKEVEEAAAEHAQLHLNIIGRTDE